MLECKVCGTKFNAIIERHFISTDKEEGENDEQI